MPASRKFRAAVLAAVTLALVAAVSCAVPNPSPAETVGLRWGNLTAQHRNVSYGPHPANTADVYLPTKGGNRGVIITVHGGAFFTGQRSDTLKWFGPVLRETHRGFAVLNISYRLNGTEANPFPAAAHDVAAAVNWVRAHGRQYGMNPHTVVVVGHSAGGTIASLVGVAANGDGPAKVGRSAKVDGWVSFAGIYDFTRPGTDLVDTIGRAWYADRSKAAIASPIRYLDRSDPPAFVVHGDRDTTIPLAQAQLLLAQASAQGIGARMHYDIVDTGPADCRAHTPQCGMNAATFDRWLDQVVAREL